MASPKLTSTKIVIVVPLLIQVRKPAGGDGRSIYIWDP
jgi:hypothetical protein